MIIAPVDNKADLFTVSDIIPQSLLEEISQLDLNSIPWTKEQWQQEYNRKRLKPCGILQKVDDIIKSNLDKINEITNINAEGCATGFWLDGPGFTMTSHIDNSNVFASMQLFLLDCASCPGTKFTLNGADRFVVKHQKNSGYIMINGLDQYHEVAGSVPDNKLRLSSYTWFFPKL